MGVQIIMDGLTPLDPKSPIGARFYPDLSPLQRSRSWGTFGVEFVYSFYLGHSLKYIVIP